jgi:hypothetical protein
MSFLRKRKETSLDEENSVSLLDILSIDLLFDTIVKCLFLFCNGVQSFCSVALVCRTTYKRALYQNRVKRLLAQSFPYLPDHLLNANRTDTQMFSLLLSLANPNFMLRNARPALYRNLVTKTLRSNSLLLQYYYSAGEVVRGQHDYKDPTSKKIYCELRNGSFSVNIVWFDCRTNLLHSRRFVCQLQMSIDFEVHASGDVVEEKIYFTLKQSFDPSKRLKQSLDPSKLLQITVDCSKFICNAGTSCVAIVRGVILSNLCNCADFHFHADSKPNVSEHCFVSWHTYNFKRLLPVDIETRNMYNTKLSGIAKYLQTYRILPNLVALINLQTHETSFVQCREDLYFEIGQTFTIDSRHGKIMRKNICAISRSNNTGLPFEPHFVLPQFAYRN